MPVTAAKIEKEVAKKTLRNNLFVPILIWLVVGIAKGGWIIVHYAWIWGIVLILFSIGLFFLISRTALVKLSNSDEVEVKEIFNAFLAGYKVGIFENKEEKK